MASGPRAAGRRFRRNSLATIGIIFVLVFALLQALLFVLEAGDHVEWLTDVTALTMGAIVGWMGIPVSVSGHMVTMSNHVLAIDYDCTGLAIVTLYSALVVAYPLNARTRLLALGVGIPAIAVANMGRLVGVALASQYLGQDVFLFVHDYLFKVVMVLVVVGLWAVWLQMARTHAARA